MKAKVTGERIAYVYRTRSAVDCLCECALFAREKCNLDGIVEASERSEEIHKKEIE